MKKLTLFLFTITLFLSCEENDNNTICEEVIIVCDEQNPLENFTFLKEAKDTIDHIDCSGRSSIIQYTYKSETVFEIIICDQVSDHQILVYNCSGDIICSSGGIEGVDPCPDFNDKATDKIILYGN